MAQFQRFFYWSGVWKTVLPPSCKVQHFSKAQKSIFFNLAQQTPPPQWAMASLFTRFLDHTQHAPQSVELLWTSDQLVAEISTWQHTTLTTDRPCPRGIRTHNLSRRTAVDRAVTGTGVVNFIWINFNKFSFSWRIKDQLDVTCNFISLLMCSTCFGH